MKQEKIPAYISRLEVFKSKSSSNPFIVRGVVTTGQGETQYVVEEGETLKDATEKFLISAARTYAAIRRL